VSTCKKICIRDCEDCRRSSIKLTVGLLIVFTVAIPIIPFIISLILQET
jgi:hypothetical protein